MDTYNKKRLIHLTLAGIVFVGIIGGACNYALKTKKEVKEIDNDNHKGFTNNTVVENNTLIDNKKESSETKKSEPLTNEEVKTITNNEVPVVTKNQNTITEEETVAYFESMEKKIDSYTEENNFDKFKDKTSAVFITAVDFIFYGGEIKDKTFEELSDETKLKILNIAKNIDAKIMTKWPTYKEDIKTTSKNTYNKVTEKIGDGIEYVDNKLEEKIGTEKYQETKDKVTNTAQNIKDKAVETYNNVKDSETYNNVKESVSNTIDAGKSKVKTWYEDFKNKHQGE